MLQCLMTFYHCSLSVKESGEVCILALQKQLRVNVLGSVRPTQALLPQMIERQEGRIVFISSMAGQVCLSKSVFLS